MPEYDNARPGRDTELVLPPNTYAFVQDNTKGQVTANHGPYKTSLSNTDQLVTFDGKRFVPATLANAIQSDIIVPKGSYVVLENPASNQPTAGTANTLPLNHLRMGQVENLPGPLSFALWPGQIATVIKGHHLRSNQYLLGRVTDDEAAKANWNKSVVKAITTDTDAAKQVKNNPLGIDENSLVTGQIIVIRGTDVSFYIPPTGIEVLADENNKYVRDAVTLERLEYSILLDENGNKEYRIGPDVVFPRPTQQFYTKDGARKFRAQELQPTSGMHIKVTADYKDDDGTEHRAGDEIFITGVTHPIYYPREEHSVMTYGPYEKTFATAIPAGEGRYVLNRATGDIELVVGPKIFLPDPRQSVVVRRILSDTECQLYYPGNDEVLRVNRELRGAVEDNVRMLGDSSENLKGLNYSSVEEAFEDTRMRTRSFAPSAAASSSMFESLVAREAVGKGIAGDKINRGTKYTPPRTITLNTKYDGAVRISVYTGYAVQVVNSAGNRRTVVGPQTILLGYDEYLERLNLSTGKPKTADKCIKDVYLRIKGSVSDIITTKTKDLVSVRINVKYLVRFEDDHQSKWFNQDNYVQMLVDHMRSIINNKVRAIGVQEFYSNAANILRDTVLGVKDATTGERPLHNFDENGMTIYDLEMIEIQVVDNEVASLLSAAHRNTLEETIQLGRKQSELETKRGIQEAERKIKEEEEATAILADKLARDAAERIQANVMASVKAENAKRLEEENGRKAVAELSKVTQQLLLDVTASKDAHTQLIAQQEADRRIEALKAEAEAAKEKMGAIQPSLVEAIVALAQSGQFEAIAEHLAPLSIVRGESLAGTLTTMFQGTALEGMVKNIDNLSKVKPAAR